MLNEQCSMFIGESLTGISDRRTRNDEWKAEGKRRKVERETLFDEKLNVGG
jgi:hypothetical protein